MRFVFLAPREMSFVVTAIALLLIATVRDASLVAAHDTPGEPHLYLDVTAPFCTTNDAHPSSTAVMVGSTYQVGICLQNQAAPPIAFEATIPFNAAITFGPELSDVAPALADNPDANDGIGSGFIGPSASWDCTSFGFAYPQANDGSGRTHIVCNGALDGSTSTLSDSPGLLATITYIAADTGANTLDFTVDGSTSIDDLAGGGYCNDPFGSLKCYGATVTHLPAADIVLSAVAPGVATPGSSISYSLGVENQGPMTATNVNVFDDVEDDWTVTSITVDGVEELGGLCGVYPALGPYVNVAWCGLGAMFAVESHTVVVAATTSLSLSGAVVNAAIAGSGSLPGIIDETPDPDFTPIVAIANSLSIMTFDVCISDRYDNTPFDPGDYVDYVSGVECDNAALAVTQFGDSPSVTVFPPNASGVVDAQHSVTATVLDEDDNAVPSAVVMFVVTGANSATGVRTTNTSGVTPAFTYTGTNPGTDTITASATVNSQNVSGFATMDWSGITLTPLSATNDVGELHTVTAQVSPASENVSVTFTVTGANPNPLGAYCVPANCETDALGQVTYSYTGFNPGNDAITADASGSGFGTGQAFKTWALEGIGFIFPVAGGQVGDGLPPLDASFDTPAAVARDVTGRLYIADTAHHRVRRISPGSDGVVNGSPDEVITTIAGTGIATGSIDGPGGDPLDDLADGAAATNATLNAPAGIAVDTLGNNIYVSDTGNHRVRKITFAGVISTIAGTGVAGFTSEGPATATTMQLDQPRGLTLDSTGDLLIADACNHRVRRLNAPALTTLETVAGGGNNGCALGDFDDDDPQPATSARLNRPYDVFAVGAGYYIADACNHRIRHVDPTGTLTTIAGSGLPGFGSAACGTGGYGGDGGSATAAMLDHPTGVMTALGVVYIADRDNCRVRRVSGGTITTIAGGASCGSSGDGGPADLALLDAPSDIVSGSQGDLHVVDSLNHRVRLLDPGADAVDGDPDDLIFSVAGTGSAKYCGDGGTAVAASCVAAPDGLAVNGAGDLYIADTANHRVRYVRASDGSIRTVAGTGIAGYCGDGGDAQQACLNAPADIEVGSDGTLYISDRLNHVIRAVSTGGDGVVDGAAGETITTFAGSGAPGLIDDANASAQFDGPRGLAFVGIDLYVADTNNCRVRMISGGSVSTFAGTSCGFSDGSVGSAQLGGLRDIAIHPAGLASGIYVADTGNCRVRRIAGGVVSTIAGSGSCAYGGDFGLALAAGLEPAGLGFLPSGTLIVSDLAGHRLRTVKSDDGSVLDGSGTELIFTSAGGYQPTPGFCGDPDENPTPPPEVFPRFATDACLDTPSGIARALDGNLYFADTGNDRVRKVPNDCDLDGLVDAVEDQTFPKPTPPYAQTWYCDSDTDGDGHRDAQSSSQSAANLDPNTDSCPLLTNPGQENFDAGPIDNGPGVAQVDFTAPNGDALGDLCDPDIDNDGLSNTDELSPSACAPFDLSTTLHPNPSGADNNNDDDDDGDPAPPMGSDAADDGPSWDTDNDGALDGVECALGTNPRDRTSKPTTAQCGGSADVDLDGLTAATETCKWGTDPVTYDSDGDGLNDCVEANDTNGDGFQNFPGDTINSAKAANGLIGKTMDFDLNGDGFVNFPGDTITSAKMANHVGGICL